MKKIIFTINKRGDEHSFQYLVSLKNESLKAVEPKISILLFNDLGIQVGSSHIMQDDSLKNPDPKLSLEAGEIRSTSSTIWVPPSEEPKYFLIRYM